MRTCQLQLEEECMNLSCGVRVHFVVKFLYGVGVLFVVEWGCSLLWSGGVRCCGVGVHVVVHSLALVVHSTLMGGSSYQDCHEVDMILSMLSCWW